MKLNVIMVILPWRAESCFLAAIAAAAKLAARLDLSTGLFSSGSCNLFND